MFANDIKDSMIWIENSWISYWSFVFITLSLISGGDWSRQDMSLDCSRWLICQWQDCTKTTKILELPENHLFVEKTIIHLPHICPNDTWRITISSEKMPKDCKIANPWQMNLLIFDIRHLLLSIPFIDSDFSRGGAPKAQIDRSHRDEVHTPTVIGYSY